MKRSKNNAVLAFLKAKHPSRDVVFITRKGDMKPDFIALVDRVDAGGVPTDFILTSERDYQALHRHYYRRDRSLVRLALGESLWLAREVRAEFDRPRKGLKAEFEAFCGFGG